MSAGYLANSVDDYRSEIDELKKAREALGRSDFATVMIGSVAVPAPSDLLRIWVDRRIDTVQAALRVALIELRDYAVSELAGA